MKTVKIVLRNADDYDQSLLFSFSKTDKTLLEIYRNIFELSHELKTCSTGSSFNSSKIEFSDKQGNRLKEESIPAEGDFISINVKC